MSADIGLTGTKLGCGEGGCGACTVMLSSMENGELHHRSANACLCPLYSVDGMHVVTVEGMLLYSDSSLVALLHSENFKTISPQGHPLHSALIFS